MTKKLVEKVHQLLNSDLVYANFTNLTFQKVSVPHLKRTMKFALSEIMRSDYFFTEPKDALTLIGMSYETKKNILIFSTTYSYLYNKRVGFKKRVG